MRTFECISFRCQLGYVVAFQTSHPVHHLTILYRPQSSGDTQSRCPAPKLVCFVPIRWRIRWCSCVQCPEKLRHEGGGKPVAESGHPRLSAASAFFSSRPSRPSPYRSRCPRLHPENRQPRRLQPADKKCSLNTLQLQLANDVAYPSYRSVLRLRQVF